MTENNITVSRPRYPWTHPDIVLEASANRNKDPFEIVRAKITELMGVPPDAPVPWLLIIMVHYTRPGPDPGDTIEMVEFFPRIPTAMSLHLPKILRQDAILDISYAR